MTNKELNRIKEKYIQDLRAGQAYSIGKFDDQVLLISSGTLVLSLSFITDIVTLDQAEQLGLLYASWWTLTAAIVVSVGSHLVSYHLTERQVKRVENDEKLPDDRWIISLNYATAALLVFGIIFQIVFVTQNIKAMSDENKTVKLVIPKDGYEKLGLPIPSAPKAIKTQGDTVNSTKTKSK